MHKLIAKFFINTILIAIIPWQLFCAEHPLGHEEHPSDELSPCELHDKYAHIEGDFILPPMHCKHYNASVDEFSHNHNNFKIFDFQQIIGITITDDYLLNFNHYPQKKLRIKLVSANTDPPFLSDISPRAPSFV